MKTSCELLGQILIKAGKIKASDLENASNKQRLVNLPIGEILAREFPLNSDNIKETQYFKDQQKLSGITLIKDKIGQILKYIGVINDKQIEQTLQIQKETAKLFGEILIEKKLIQPRFLNDIILAANGDKEAVDRLTDKKLGELLVDLNFLEDKSLQPILEEQSTKSRGKRIGALISERGLLSPSKISKVLKMQKKLASLTMITIFSTSMLAGCKTPRVSSFASVENYSDSNQADSGVIKVLQAKASGSVNYYKDGTIAISNIPFYRQGNDNTCAQAVMTSLLNFWGVGVDYQTVVNQTNSANLFTDVDKITSYLRKNHLYAQDYRQATLNFVKDRVQKGWPVILLLDFGKVSSEHYVLATGYNDETQELILMDPIDGPNIKMSYEQVEMRWANLSLKKIGLFGDKYTRIVFDVSGNE